MKKPNEDFRKGVHSVISHDNGKNWYFYDEAASEVGPYASPGQAVSYAKAHEVFLDTGKGMPKVQGRYRHPNGAEYVVIAIANEHSDREDEYPPAVVYQGDNGRVWTKPLKDFIRKMTLVPPSTVTVEVTARGPVEVSFIDHMGYKVVLEEHPTAKYLKLGYPNQMPVLLDRDRCILLSNYLGSYITNDQLPENPL